MLASFLKVHVHAAAAAAAGGGGGGAGGVGGGAGVVDVSDAQLPFQKQQKPTHCDHFEH